MADLQKELINTLQLLKQEWEEDLLQYKEKNLKGTLVDKKKQGICWYPLLLKKVKMGYGERFILEVERSDSDQSHGFQSGKSVSLFSNFYEHESKMLRVNGVVNFVKKDTMVITLGGDHLPDWIDDGKLGVDLLFDEASYREMEWTLKTLINMEGGRTAVLRDVLLGGRQAEYSPSSSPSLPALNEGQNQAVRLINGAKDLAIVHGPPGTGKTTTLVAAVAQAAEKHLQVMVCAPSNAAVDLLVEKLCDKGLSVLRMGHPARIDDNILMQTLDAKMTQHESYKELKKLRKSAEEFRSSAKKYKRNFGKAERSQRKRMFDEADQLKKEASVLENYIIDDIFGQTQVVATTLVGANGPFLKGRKFPVVFMDEAGQGLEPAAWIPVLKTEKIVLAGDHCQLPPTIKSFEAAKAGLSETLFEKAIKRQSESSRMLNLQYRMPELIMQFSAEQFYNDQLKAAPNTYDHFLEAEEPVMTFIDTAGSGFSEEQEEESLSTYNPEEARFTANLLEGLIGRIGVERFLENHWDIGLISPYRAQVRRLRELLLDHNQYPMIHRLSEVLTVDTIDAFQGQERDVIVISLARSNSEGEIGFLSDIRRMNVALTRAKRKLMVVGDSSTLSHHRFYQNFMDYVEKHHLYKSVYEFMEY